MIEKFIKADPLMAAAIGAGVIFAAYTVYKIQTTSAAGLGASVGKAAVDAGVGVIGGINDALGVPRTSEVLNWWRDFWNPVPQLGNDHPINLTYRR